MYKIIFRPIFSKGASRFGITNPLDSWEYTVTDDGVETCVWIPPFMTPDVVEAWLSFIVVIISLVGKFCGLTVLVFKRS